jgi:acetyltransferase EpsM
MANLTPIKVPLLNPNEPQALLASLLVEEGRAVKHGQVIAVIETTKSIGEIEAERSGYVVGLGYQQGDSLEAGAVLAYIGDAPDAKDPALPPWSQDRMAPGESQSARAGLRITEPARELALAKGLALDDLPHGPLVTRQMVQDLLAQAEAAPTLPIPEGETRLVIYGAGGHGCSLAALVRLSSVYQIVGFLDDGLQAGSEVDGLLVLGGGEKLPELAQSGIRLAVNGVGGIGDLPARLSVYDQLRKAGFHCPAVIHQSAFIEASALLADGVQVYPLAYVGIRVRVGYGCIINTGAIVSHDCTLADYVNLSPGATLAGGVTVGEAALVGMRATVNLGVSIGKGTRIGNGATVKADVPDGGIVPAGTIWPPRK